MECLLIPLVIFGIGLVLTIPLAWKGISSRYGSEDWGTAAWICGILCGVILIISLLTCPINYASTKADLVRMQAYYDHVIMPHVVEETSEYVVVEGLETALWQAGDYTIASYNKELAGKRYWDSFAIIGSAVATPPDSLKLIRVK